MKLHAFKSWASPLAFGLLLGLGAGLLIGWVLWPLQYYESDPVRLAPQQKATYITLTGLAYRMDRDLDRARVRLYALQDPDIVARVQDMASESIKHGDDPDMTEGLALLAQALGATSATIRQYLASPTVPTPTTLPVASPSWTPATGGGR